MLTSEFSYELPPELIAQEPPPERGTSRMMVLRRSDGAIEHRSVSDLPEYLRAGDLMVLNDTRVFPARIFGRWDDTAGSLELLFLERLPGCEPGVERWRCITGSGRPVRSGQRAAFAEGRMRAEIAERLDGGCWAVAVRGDRPVLELLEQHGLTPVPPYIHRHGDERTAQLDRERYQTIYAREAGAVAAPTAGLHFGEELFARLDARGVRRAFVTLHVGPGTFKPVKAARVEDHRMDPERYEVSDVAAEAIASCKSRGGRVLCVGSTSVRTLETVAAANGGRVVAAAGASAMFIYPPYAFLAADLILTNFHLPQSTLLMMVSAFAGREAVMDAYAEAVRERYRFFSYGDCMLIT
jgi:S-adenosylmethionine:tRNA ribosyltransferase-isomerase